MPIQEEDLTVKVHVEVDLLIALRLFYTRPRVKQQLLQRGIKSGMVGWQIPTAVNGVITRWSHKQPLGTPVHRQYYPEPQALKSQKV